MEGRQKTWIALLFAAIVLLYGSGLGAIDLWAPDEPRYGQVAEEMRAMQHGGAGLVLLHLNGEAYTQKPPLYYWLAALSGWLAGDRVTETAARLPSALSGIAVVAATLWLGQLLFAGSTAGLWAAAVCGTVFRFAHCARRAQLDVLLTLLETLALIAFWQLDSRRTSPGGPAARRILVGMHLAIGLAALTKGPVGWLPLLVIVAYLAWERRLGDLRRLAPPWALLLSFGPLLAWITAATALAPPGFFEQAVVANVFGRVIAATSHVRPFYYFLYQLPLDFMPWTLLWPLAFLVGRRQLRGAGVAASSWRFLVSWVFVPLALFSLASGKRGIYLLPCFPALALLCGAALDRWLERRAALPRWLVASLTGTAAAVATGGLALAYSDVLEPLFPEGFELGPATALALSGIAAAGLGIGWLGSRGGHPARGLVAVVATVLALEWAIFTRVYPEYDGEKSPRPIARAAAALSHQDEVVGIFDDEGLGGAILYYGDRRVAILPRPPAVEAFLDRGGRLVLLERWKLPWLDEVGRFEVLGSARSGARELAIVERIGATSP